MKAVIYHADGPIAKKYPPGTYQRIFQGFRENAARFNVPVIHITTRGHPGWGDENFFIDADPANIIYNRELGFTEFLSKAPDDVYWFTEPDSRIINLWPQLDCDLALLYRGSDTIKINPSWRLARPSSLPFFKKALEFFDLDHKTWDGDSVAFKRIWHDMGEPSDVGHIDYLGLRIDLRNFKAYCMEHSKFSRQLKADNKLSLL